MKTYKILAGSLAALVIGVAGASAQGMGREPPPVPFEEMDTDRSGEVTQAEMQAHGQARFDAADLNGDGYLSQDELVANAPTGARIFVGRLIARADADGDGRLTIVEMRNAVPDREAMFDEMDTDNSGGLTKAELEAGQKMMRQSRANLPVEQG